VAYDVWKSEKEGANAANGSLMRTFPTGLWDFWDAQAVIDNTITAGFVTHVDPRCVNACIMFTFLLSQMLNDPKRIEQMIPEKNELLAIAKNADPNDLNLHDAVTYKKNISALKLGTKIGYVYRALSAAVWAFYNAKDYEHGIVTIISCGGDADTNACVAGALLGAKFGFESIPAHLVNGLVHKDVLTANVDRFIAEMEKRA
jgi:ADP-ribosylglycohydrolase